jgi:hypothetical protein
MPQLDFFNILSQLEYGIIFFMFFYFFNIFFVIPTIITIFQLRTIFFGFPIQLFNFFSILTLADYNYVKEETKEFSSLVSQSSYYLHSTVSFNKTFFEKINLFFFMPIILTSIIIPLYIVLVYMFSYFYFFDPEYFLFFSSTALFITFSYFTNSFVESAIKAKYDIQLSRLILFVSHLEVLEKFVTEFHTNFNFFNFFSLVDAKIDEIDSEIFTYFNNDETLDILIDNLYAAFLIQNFTVSSTFSNSVELLTYNEAYETLILMLIQDPWRWKRRTRINKSLLFNKYFKTSKKYPVVAWPLKPGEYKIPRDLIDL